MPLPTCGKDEQAEKYKINQGGNHTSNYWEDYLIPQSQKCNYTFFEGLYNQTFKRNRAIILDQFFVTFFKHWCNVCRFPFNRWSAVLSWVVKYICQRSWYSPQGKRDGMPSGPWALQTFRPISNFLTSDLKQDKYQIIWSVCGRSSSRNWSGTPGLSINTDVKNLLNSCALLKTFVPFWFSKDTSGGIDHLISNTALHITFLSCYIPFTGKHQPN